MTAGDAMIEAIAEAVAERVLSRLQQPAPAANEPLAYPPAEAARLMNVSLSTLKNMMRDREIEVVRRGTKVLITRKAINKFFEAHEA